MFRLHAVGPAPRRGGVRRGRPPYLAVDPARHTITLDGLLGSGAPPAPAITGNPSTNALYPRLGYRYRHDAVMLEFACPG